MFGFFIGTLCLIGLIKVVRSGRRQGFGFGPRRFYNRIFRKLDTSLNQEKEIVDAMAQLRQSVEALRDELRVSKGDLAVLLERDEVTEAELDALWERHESALAATKKAASQSFLRVHQTLDRVQRATLARMIARAGHRFR